MLTHAGVEGWVPGDELEAEAIVDDGKTATDEVDNSSGDGR